MIGEGGKAILGKTLMTNKEELKDEITPLKSMQGVVGCCISTSLSIISFLSISFLLRGKNQKKLLSNHVFRINHKQ